MYCPVLQKKLHRTSLHSTGSVGKILPFPTYPQLLHIITPDYTAPLFCTTSANHYTTLYYTVCLCWMHCFVKSEGKMPKLNLYCRAETKTLYKLVITKYYQLYNVNSILFTRIWNIPDMLLFLMSSSVFHVCASCMASAL